MAELFYEITQDEADAISKFSVDARNKIDPYCGKQVNGNYIIRVDDVNACSEMAQIQAVDFSGKVDKTAAQLDFPVVPEFEDAE